MTRGRAPFFFFTLTRGPGPDALQFFFSVVEMSHRTFVSPFRF